MIPHALGSTLFPYTTLFRSDRVRRAHLNVENLDTADGRIGVVGAVVDDGERATATHQRIGTDRERSAGYGHERASRIPLLPGNTAQRIMEVTGIIRTDCHTAELQSLRQVITDLLLETN